VLIQNIKLPKLFTNKPDSMGKMHFKNNYGRLFNNQGERINNLSSSEKIEKFAKNLIDSDKLGWFLFDLKKKIKSKSGMKTVEKVFLFICFVFIPI
jgi:hypothetical protein